MRPVFFGLARVKPAFVLPFLTTHGSKWLRGGGCQFGFVDQNQLLGDRSLSVEMMAPQSLSTRVSHNRLVFFFFGLKS